jgi:hypothetical protein
MLFGSVAIRKEKNNRAVFRYVCGVCSSVCLEVSVNRTGESTLVAGSWEGHTESRTSGSPRGPTSAVDGVEKPDRFSSVRYRIAEPEVQHFRRQLGGAYRVLAHPTSIEKPFK